jgi:hypothetical protein
MPQTDEHDLVKRTEDSIKRFVQYDKSLEADPAFRATVGASQPKVASSRSLRQKSESGSSKLLTR